VLSDVRRSWTPHWWTQKLRCARCCQHILAAQRLTDKDTTDMRPGNLGPVLAPCQHASHHNRENLSVKPQ